MSASEPTSLNALGLQELGLSERALCIVHMIEASTGESTVPATTIKGLANDLNLPPSSNLSRDLARLVQRNHLIKKGAGWAITPAGRHYLETRFEFPPVEVLVANRSRSPGAEISGIRHAPVVPEMAPTAARDGVQRICEGSEWARNVMMVTRFPREGLNDDPIEGAIATIREVTSQHGLNLLVASERRADDRLGVNVVSHMWASMYGIALLEDRAGEGLNPNVVFEVGALVMTGRRVLVVRDHTSPPVPSDFTDHIYDKIDIGDPGQLAETVHKWVRDDLVLGGCAGCPTT